MLASNSVRPAWRAALATLLYETGRLEQARPEFELLAAEGFVEIPEDGDWLTAVTLTADCCVALRDGERAAQLYELLYPYRDSNVVIGLGAVCLGSAARYLGRLAAATGRTGDATEHFEHALAANAALRAPVCLAHTQVDFAQLLEGGRRAEQLRAEAAQTAQRLGLPMLARRAATA
jgi:tetratricopeptide (TPR) repeat protein